MLSLKGSRLEQQRQRKTTISDFPAEVLDIVLDHVYFDADCRLDGILPSSLTCRQFRQSLTHILFQSLTILVGRGLIQSRSYTTLQYMSTRPQLLKHVRNLDIRTPLFGDSEGYNSDSIEALESQNMVITCLPKMVALCSVRQVTSQEQMLMPSLANSFESMKYG